MDIKNIKKFTRQEAEAGIDSLDLDSGRPSSTTSGDKTVTIEGSLHDGLDIDDLDEDPSKKSDKEGYEVSESNDVSMHLDLEDEDTFDLKDETLFSALNIKLEKIQNWKNDKDGVTPNIVKNTTEFFGDINQHQGGDITIGTDNDAKELEKEKSAVNSGKPFEVNSKSEEEVDNKKDNSNKTDLQKENVSVKIEEAVKVDDSKSTTDKLESYSKSKDLLPAEQFSTEISEIGEKKDKNATRPTSAVLTPMKEINAAIQEDIKRLGDSEVNKETFHMHYTDQWASNSKFYI